MEENKMPDNKTLVRFNVQNIKYATPSASGGFNTPVAYGTALKMALQEIGRAHV